MPELHNNRVKITKTKPSFTREQRAGFFLVAVSGCLAVILGVVYLFDHLADPFSIDYEGPRFVSSQEQEQAELREQSQTDTDGDELTDYDELYVFRTSPYLADTDGDGYNDFAELQAGTDPTCAKGEECADFYELNNIDKDQVALYLESLSSSGEAVSEIKTILESFTPEDVRQLLLDAGLTESQLSQISDEDLSSLYQSVLGDLQDSGDLDQLVEDTIEQVQ